MGRNTRLVAERLNRANHLGAGIARPPLTERASLPWGESDETFRRHVGRKLERGLEDRIATEETKLLCQQLGLVRNRRDDRPDHAAHLRAVASGRDLVLV